MKAPSHERIEESRRQFFSTCALIAAAVVGESIVASALSGCGSTTASSAGNCLADGAGMAVGTTVGHSHTAPPVSAADVSADAQKVYTLGSSQSHTHTVTLSTSNFTTLKGNQSVTLSTDTDSTGHTHAITVNCS